MFESLLVVNLVLVITASLGVLITLKAALQAWQERDFYAEPAEGQWGWWIELNANHPQCLYYFGPFGNSVEAENAMAGYIQDLSNEGADSITVQVKWCKPRQLTVPSTNASEII